jgi:hypothetical protein
VAVLWTGCKHGDDHAIPNVTPHNSGSESDPTVTKQESIAEPPSTDLDSATTGSQSVVSEATKDRDGSQFSGFGSHTTGNIDELPSSIGSIENCMQELGDFSSCHSSGSHTTGKTEELLISVEQCIQELEEAQQRFETGQYNAE